MAVIWQLQLVQFKDHYEVSGVILEKDPPAPSNSPLLNGLRVARTYFIDAWAGRKISLHLGASVHELTTDRSGGFVFRGVGRAQLQPRVENSEGEMKLAQRYPVVFPYQSAGLSVISDIDDTVIRSYSAHMFRRMYTTLFTTTRNRAGIDYVTAIYRQLNEYDVPVYYVSKSESNLFDVLTSVFQLLDVPQGPFFLTPYLTFNGLFGSKQADHKHIAIRKIMEGLPDRKFLLFGDDTQRDMQVYRQVIHEYPGRILKVYIHRTRKVLAGEKESEFENLKASGVPVVYFDKEDNIKSEIEFLIKIQG